MKTNGPVISLSQRLIVRLSLAIGMVSVMACTVMVFVIAGAERRALENEADLTIAHLSGMAEKPLWDFDADTLTIIGKTFARNNRICRLTFLGEHGEKIYAFQSADADQGVKRQADVRHGGQKIGEVQVTYTKKFYYRNVGMIVLSTTLVVLLIIGLIFLVTDYLVRTQLRAPLEQLSQRVEKYAAGENLGDSFAVSLRELRPFGAVLSMMGKRIREQLDQMNASNAELIRKNESLMITERELRQSEAKARAIFDSSFGLVGLLTPEGRLLDVNQTALDFAGVTHADVKGKYFWDTPWWSRSPEAQHQIREAIQAAAAGKCVREESSHWDKDGVLRTIDFTLKPVMDETGKVTLLIPEGRDITERKHAEAELTQHREHLEVLIKQRTAELLLARDAAEAANRAKSVFLANMSHEIRTPMNAVLGFAQLLQRDPSLSSEGRNKVNTILKSGEHLLSIINAILEMSRIEAGRAQLHAEAMDLHDLLNDLTAIFRLRTQAKGLSFSLDCADNLPRHIVSDLGKLRQILTNLLGNAFKFTPKGGIGLRAVPVGSDRVAIEVRDTGIGIAVEEQAALFRPFERARSGEQTAAGTGLGLAISREYAHLLGGEITVESRLGAGSCFRLEFQAPMATVVPAATAPLRRVTGLAKGQGEIRVLVVDDLHTNRELLRGMLEPLGFAVEVACDGEEAIAKATATLPRIILMDLVMPGMDGCETSQRLRQMLPPAPVTIIGISASVFKADIQLFLAAGINAFIAKPFHEQELFDLLSRHAGVVFESEVMPALGLSVGDDRPTLDKMPQEWRDAFAQARIQGSISRLRRLGEEAQSIDPVLARFVLERVTQYDLMGLSPLDGDNATGCDTRESTARGMT